jgi:hypothetical protein
MADRRRKDKTVAFVVVLRLGKTAQRLGDVRGDRRFFRYNKRFSHDNGGSRYCNGIRVINWPMKRLLLSTGAARYVRWITGMPFSDPTGGFKCFRRRALASIDLDGGAIQRLQLPDRDDAQNLDAGKKVVEIPIIFTDRFHGTSKMSRKIVWEALAMVWRLCGFQNGLRRSPRVTPAEHPS